VFCGTIAIIPLLSDKEPPALRGHQVQGRRASDDLHDLVAP
jgi:hypothetical protein